MQASIDRKRVTQIGILVHNVKQAAKQWAEFLRVETPEIFVTDPYEKTGAMYWGEPCRGLLYQAFFNFENIQVELIQPVDDTPSIWRECLDRDGEGMHHISFGVKNMAENISQCEEQKMPLIQKGEYKGGRYAYLDAFRDMKIVLELIEND